MKTGDDYRASIRDGRRVFFDGEQVEDVTTHPLMRHGVDRIARGEPLRELSAGGVPDDDEGLQVGSHPLKLNNEFLEHRERADPCGARVLRRVQGLTAFLPPARRPVERVLRQRSPCPRGPPEWLSGS